MESQHLRKRSAFSIRRPEAGRNRAGCLFGLVLAAGLFGGAGHWENVAGRLSQALHRQQRPRSQGERVLPAVYAVVPDSNFTKMRWEGSAWREIGAGLWFRRIRVFRAGTEVDTLAVVRMEAERNELRVVTGYRGREGVETRTLADWQTETQAAVVFNANQYMESPSGRPCALVKSAGVRYGPDFTSRVRGAIVSQPIRHGLPDTALLDFDYAPGSDRPSAFARSRTASAYRQAVAPRLADYREVVCHWPILLDRQGRIRVEETSLQARRTVVATDREGRFLVLTTEGEFFTLHNLGKLLRDDRQLEEPLLDVHTAMNLDGGSVAGMVVNTPALQYVSSGRFETVGPDRSLSVPGLQVPLPTVICLQAKEGS